MSEPEGGSEERALQSNYLMGERFLPLPAEAFSTISQLGL
jgi:hypothetical protein